MDCLGKVALVTGAARRVGRAIALELAAAGCDVAVHYSQSAADAQTVVEQIQRLGRRAASFPTDLGNHSAPVRLVRAVLDQFGRLDVLINNASIFLPDPPSSFDGPHWQTMMQVNAIAPAGLMVEAAEALAATEYGKIINLVDIAADRPWPGYLAYCASKAALVNLTRGAARKFAPRIQVNGVAPGVAAFPDAFPAAQREKLIAQVPLKRSGAPEDVAAAVRFLVAEGDYITGQIINVDGGRSIA
jgi:pteridine reductase